MKISGNRQVQSSSVRKAGAKPSSGGGFSVTSTAPTVSSEVATGVSTASPIASVDALLSIQEVPNERESRRQAVERGRSMLDILDEIRLGLLVGSVPKNRLEQLVKMVESRRDGFQDPALSEVLDEIELRARVELAKFQRYAG